VVIIFVEKIIDMSLYKQFVRFITRCEQNYWIFFWQPKICFCLCWNGTRSSLPTNQRVCFLPEKAMHVQQSQF